MFTNNEVRSWKFEVKIKLITLQKQKKNDEDSSN